MTKYIALLRGVNVGGNNKIAMPELRAAFEQYGFQNVVSYINSGNILFDSDMDLQVAKVASESVIEVGFGLKIAIGIISAADWIKALEHTPAWWGSDKDSKHNAIFVIPPASVGDVLASVGEAKPEYESVAYYGNVIFWTAPIKTFSRSRFAKIVNNKAVYNLITIRNVNTALKLAALAKREFANGNTGNAAIRHIHVL